MSEALQRIAGAVEQLVVDSQARRAGADESWWRAHHGPLPRAGLSFVAICQRVPGLAALFDTPIPPDFWTLVDDGRAQVACPCGATPELAVLRPEACDCGRYFLYTIRDVRVAFSPKDNG